jgi:hypothetical protein
MTLRYRARTPEVGCLCIALRNHATRIHEVTNDFDKHLTSDGSWNRCGAQKSHWARGRFENSWQVLVYEQLGAQSLPPQMLCFHGGHYAIARE